MAKNPYFSEKQDEAFGEYFRRVLIQSNPNPDRIGCPDSQIIRDLVFRRQVSPEISQKATSHMMKCSECVRDALDYVAEYEESKQTTEE